MGDVDEVAAILDLITATQIQLHAMALVLEETGVKNVESRLDAIRNRLMQSEVSKKVSVLIEPCLGTGPVLRERYPHLSKKRSYPCVHNKLLPRDQILYRSLLAIAFCSTFNS